MKKFVKLFQKNQLSKIIKGKTFETQDQNRERSQSYIPYSEAMKLGILKSPVLKYFQVFIDLNRPRKRPEATIEPFELDDGLGPLDDFNLDAPVKKRLIQNCPDKLEETSIKINGGNDVTLASKLKQLNISDTEDALLKDEQTREEFVIFSMLDVTRKCSIPI